MTNVTLSYFDFSGGRGEECRLALHLAGIEFNDDRIGFKDWPTRKPTTPYGAVPVLSIEGKPDLAQSNAILGFIGEQHDLLPSDRFEAALHIGVMNYVEELNMQIGITISLDDEQKKAMRIKLVEGFMKEWASMIEKHIQSPFVGGEKISVADIKLYILVGWVKSGILDHIPKDFFDSSSKLIGVYDAVGKHPKVAEWNSRHN